VQLSQTSRYAIRAAIHLAEEGRERPVPVDEIARALRLPRNYLSKTLHQLARAGVLESVRGPRGGFRLAAPAGRLSLAQIVEPLDPTLGERRCLLGRPVCSDARACPVHGQWRTLGDRIDRFLRRTFLSDLVRERARPERRTRHARSTAPRARRPRARPPRPAAAR
jgi:Rrf2 family iron-sulfur cluster assembly transcriptional regulator